MHRLRPWPLAVLLLLSCAPALAQVKVDRRALDELAPPAATPPPAERPPLQRPATPPRPKPSPVAQPAPPPVAEPAPPMMPLAPDPPPVLATPPAAAAAPDPAPERPPTVPPLLPLTPPPPPVIPPPLAVPSRPPPPAVPVQVVPDAPGTATALPNGWRITFGAGRADLNAATAQALRDLARAMAADTQAGTTTATVTAFAAGTPEDPSTARRLSLSRALAARGVLIAEGIASTRITVRSLGASQPAIAAGPPDRVDVILTSATPFPSPTQAKPAP